MIKKIYFYKLEDYEYNPFAKINFISMLQQIFDTEDLTGLMLPSDLSTSSAIYNELISLVFSRFRDLAITKIMKYYNETPTNEEIENGLIRFMYRYISLLNDTHEWYMTILTNYRNAQTNLMDNIVATSKNKVKFNDTPQNSNESGVYEGDNYITHFTSTEGENSSPLMSKMMRLKEIQDNYRNIMSIWVNDFRKIFFEEDC